MNMQLSDKFQVRKYTTKLNIKIRNKPASLLQLIWKYM